MKTRVDYKHKFVFWFYSDLEERQLNKPSISSYHCKTGSEVTVSCLLAERKQICKYAWAAFSLSPLNPSDTQS